MPDPDCGLRQGGHILYHLELVPGVNPVNLEQFVCCINLCLNLDMYLFSSVTDANFKAIHPAKRPEQLEKCLAAHLGNPVEHQQAGTDNTKTAFFCQLNPHRQQNLKQIDGKYQNK